MYSVCTCIPISHKHTLFHFHSPTHFPIYALNYHTFTIHTFPLCVHVHLNHSHPLTTHTHTLHHSHSYPLTTHTHPLTTHPLTTHTRILYLYHSQVWLGRLSDEMKNTLQQLLVECVKEGRTGNRGIDPTRYPSQILCLAEQILFTERCEVAIESSTLSEFLIELESQLDSYTSTGVEVRSHDLI